MKIFSQNKEIIPDDIGEITSILIQKQANAHTKTTITASLKDWDYPETLEKFISQCVTVENDTTILCSGIVTQLETEYLPHEKLVTLHLLSATISCDEIKLSRVFQSTNKKISDILVYIKNKSGKVDSIQIPSEYDSEIPLLMIQSRETDFEFLLRLSRQFSLHLFVDDSKREKIGISLEKHSNGTPISLDLEELTVHSSKMYQEESFLLIEYSQFLQQGSTVIFQGKTFVIFETTISYEKHVARYLYLLYSSNCGENDTTNSDNKLYDLGRCNVISHEDPQRLGRLQVEFLDYEDALPEVLPWFPYLPNVTEKDAGFICYPRQGEIVRVFGQNENAYVIGCQREVEISTDINFNANDTIQFQNKKVNFSQEHLQFKINTTETSWTESELNHSSDNFTVSSKNLVKIECEEFQGNATNSLQFTAKTIKETAGSTSIEKSSSEVLVKSNKIALNKIEIK